MEAGQFKILFDGECPFCRLEVRMLESRNRGGRLIVEDISAPDFDPLRYGTTLSALMGTLHGIHPDGTQTRGMETFRQAYRAVGLGWLLAPTGWPILRPLFDLFYSLFARYRVRLGGIFGRACTDRCSAPPRAAADKAADKATDA